MQISGWPLSVFIPIFIHKNILTKAPYRGGKSKMTNIERQLYMDYNYKSHVWRVSHETSASGAAHWWTRWGELWPARCRSLRMMSPGSLPSNWPPWSSPSSSMRQDWSVVQLSVAQKQIKEALSLVVSYCNHTLYNMLLSGFLTQDHELFQNKWSKFTVTIKAVCCLFNCICSDLHKYWSFLGYIYDVLYFNSLYFRVKYTFFPTTFIWKLASPISQIQIHILNTYNEHFYALLNKILNPLHFGHL